jgi:hypothetical protein
MNAALPKGEFLMRKLKLAFTTGATFLVLTAAALSIAAQKAEAAYCARLFVPGGCIYKEIGRCFGINCGARMGLVKALPGYSCPQTYCETLD